MRSRSENGSLPLGPGAQPSGSFGSNRTGPPSLARRTHTMSPSCEFDFLAARARSANISADLQTREFPRRHAEFKPDFNLQLVSSAQTSLFPLPDLIVVGLARLVTHWITGKYSAGDKTITSMRLFSTLTSSTSGPSGAARWPVSRTVSIWRMASTPCSIGSS